MVRRGGVHPRQAVGQQRPGLLGPPLRQGEAISELVRFREEDRRIFRGHFRRDQRVFNIIKRDRVRNLSCNAFSFFLLSFFFSPTWFPQLTLLEPQSRVGDKPLNFQVVCPHNGTAVLKGLTKNKRRRLQNCEVSGGRDVRRGCIS